VELQLAWDYIKSLGDSPEHVAAYNELYPKGELVMVDNYRTTEVDTLAYNEAAHENAQRHRTISSR
jgi:hypothetical protein